MVQSRRDEACARDLETVLAALRRFRDSIACKPYAALHMETALAIENLREAAEFDGVVH